MRVALRTIAVVTALAAALATIWIAQVPAVPVGASAIDTSPPLSEAAPTDSARAKPFRYLMVDDQGRPGRWYTCTDITWTWRTASERELSLAITAFDRISDATGFTFRRTDSTAHLEVSFKPLPSNTLGYGSFAAEPVSDSNGDWRYHATSGALDIAPRARSLDARRYLNLLMHELGHVMGLDHVRTPTQVMYHRVSTRTHWGAGDLAGLRSLGRPAECAQ